ncbi:MAG: precorrin-2 C(20)-methyltransferase [Fusobacterium sp. JB021]|nr:precorrin-2 C(20)-methyltransferase [Fusobacterium sp. JB021]MDP0506720.1 precorrin-2 C(20)-methyltransferase [Fusobacterium sp. JB019]
MNKFYGIGVGVGDPEMITVKAVNILKKIDIVLIPNAGRDYTSTAYNIAKEYLKKDVKLINIEFSMNPKLEERKKERKKNAGIVEKYLKENKNVAFLTIGDPMVYSTYIYLLENISSEYQVQTISGISSFADISSRFNIPLVIGNETLKILPLHKNCDIGKEIETADNVVIMKVALKFKELKKVLKETNNENNIILVCESGKEKERVYFDLNEIDEDNVPYFSTLLLKKGGINKWKKFIS